MQQIRADTLKAIEEAKEKAVEDVTALHKKTMKQMQQSRAQGQAAKDKASELEAELQLDQQQQQVKLKTISDSSSLEQQAVQQQQALEAQQLQGLDAAVTDEQGLTGLLQCAVAHGWHDCVVTNGCEQAR